MNNINKYSEKYIRKIIKKYDLETTPISLIELTDKLNIAVYRVKMSKELQSAIRFSKEKDVYEIIVNKNLDIFSMRFAIAYELADYFFNKNKLKNCEPRMFYSSCCMSENDSFLFDVATQLLVDKEKITILSRNKISIKEMARIFYITESVVTKRILELDLL